MKLFLSCKWRGGGGDDDCGMNDGITATMAAGVKEMEKEIRKGSVFNPIKILINTQIAAILCTYFLDKQTIHCHQFQSPTF